jgi:hypothetical protein
MTKWCAQHTLRINSRFSTFFTYDFDDGGHNRENDNNKDDQREVSFDDWDISEEEAAEDKKRNPEQAANHVIGKELHISHFTDAGDKRCESSNDGHKAGYDDGFCAVFFIEVVSAVNVLLFEEPFTLVPEYDLAKILTDGVIGAIAENGGNGEEGKNRGDFERAGSGESAEGEEQGIAGEKGRYDQAGFTEDYEKENRVTPQAIVFDDVIEVPIKVQDKINQVQNETK